MRSGPCSRRAGSLSPGASELGLYTLADVFAYAAVKVVELRIDGTEVQVRRPRANRPGRRACVSGKRKQNTEKTTVISDDAGRTMWTGVIRPGRMHDQAALKTEGIWDLIQQYPEVNSPGRRRVPGPGEGLPRPGDHPRLRSWGAPKFPDRGPIGSP
ncbi:transposase family protein [Streptomyces lavendulocolor]|uniref:transposase family protein n=1 Tax=Streptomyces lavendulocolor TaxID=67316 RepID=UPI0034044111